MSLLLDALKRAEEAKRAKLSVESAPETPDALTQSQATLRAETVSEHKDQKPAGAATEPIEFKLEDYQEVIPPRSTVRPPLVTQPPVPQVDADLSLENLPGVVPVALAEGDRPLVRVTTETPAFQTRLDAASIDAAQSRDTARNVFVAKQAASPDPGTQKKWLLPVIAAVLVAVGGGGWYVWNEVTRMSRPAINIAARPLPAPMLPPAQPSTGQPGTRQPDETASKLASPVEPPLPPLLPPPAEQAPLPKLALRTPANTGTPLTRREALAKSLKDAPASRETPVELKLARSLEAPAVTAELLDAYAALRNADYPRARALYARLLLADPLNVDGQLGIATALARGGDAASSARHYRQVLAIDPRNGVALAGLLAVSDTRSPSLEVELRTLVNRNPETSSLRFTLGNLYASERRWMEAQQAYFEAYRLESGNADYMYNLAVSLDHLKQPKLALDYYRKAIAARSTTGGQFDPAAVARRIGDLMAASASN